MDFAACNPNGKIWIFWTQELSCRIIESDDQQITCELKHIAHQAAFLNTFVYAKCKDYLRRPLWDKLLARANTTQPWCTLGDFNVITSTEEKLGGLPYNMAKSFEFISVIEACGLTDLGFHGAKYTWSNLRGHDVRIWKRLDRAMVNDNWLSNMPYTSITHLPYVGSDHCPLLAEMKERNDDSIKYFKFLNCWTDNASFLETVKSCWDREMTGNPMLVFHQKMKRLSKTLSSWSRREFGDIFENVKEFEEKVKEAEEELINNNNEENRTKLHKLNAEYIRFLKLEKSILKQKTQLHWFKDGDANTRYFHALIRGRRRRLYIHKIQKDDGEWIEGDSQIAEAACDHFQAIFTGEQVPIDERILQRHSNNGF
ncbi:uncharacterized protein LOC132042983 [Lycium ferocissimum]|uniref:uncharacterized protein LOC132042983 n=1 Tax=Lycium ferocissimum TaxID=112874 RepID=UPI0028167B0F|nr:uncharacterized protein LOC132042983 [Lycium ferocissimum]